MRTRVNGFKIRNMRTRVNGFKVRNASCCAPRQSRITVAVPRVKNDASILLSFPFSVRKLHSTLKALLKRRADLHTLVVSVRRRTGCPATFPESARPCTASVIRHRRFVTAIYCKLYNLSAGTPCEWSAMSRSAVICTRSGSVPIRNGKNDRLACKTDSMY